MHPISTFSEMYYTSHHVLCGLSEKLAYERAEADKLFELRTGDLSDKARISAPRGREKYVRPSGECELLQSFSNQNHSFSSFQPYIKRTTVLCIYTDG
jgi:hypothetical protein